MFILYPCLKSSQNCDAEQGWCTIWSIWILSKRKKKTIKNKINNINFLIMIKNWYVYQIKSVKRNQVLKKVNQVKCNYKNSEGNVCEQECTTSCWL